MIAKLTLIDSDSHSGKRIGAIIGNEIVHIAYAAQPLNYYEIIKELKTHELHGVIDRVADSTALMSAMVDGRLLRDFYLKRMASCIDAVNGR